MTKKQLWCDRSILFTSQYFTLCLTEKAFHKVVKKLDLPKSQYPEFIQAGSAHATCHHFKHSDGRHISIVCLRGDKDYTLPQIHALLVHEAVHIWQYTRNDIGETSPSSEMEAYAIQNISQSLFEAYEIQKGKKHG